jgi:hypothetical protein
MECTMPESAEAVRSYLQWLEDPSSVRDHDAIAEAHAQATTAADPLERLKALSKLQTLEAVDGDLFRTRFVEHAASWAAANEVTPEAFMKLDVPRDVLEEAGLLASRGTAAARSGKRRTRVSPEMVQAAIPDGQFTIAALEDASGASTATVRKVIAEMIEAGTLRDHGPDQRHSGRGRAPLLFSRS